MAKSIYTRDSDRDGLTDAQELALGTNPLSSDSDGDGQADLVEILSGRQATFNEMRQVMQQFLDQNYESYIQALISVETGVTLPSLLKDLYDYYRANDHIQLLDEAILEVVSSQESMVKDDLEELFGKLYSTGDGNDFIQAILEGQSSVSLLSQDDWELGDYGQYSLETIDDLVQNHLSRTSDDYFGDLVQLALAQDKLDSRSQFLQAYMAELLPQQVESPSSYSLTL